MKLDELDKKRIKLDIKFFLILSTIFFGVIILILSLIAGIVAFFFKPTEGFGLRILSIFLIFFVLYILLNFTTTLKYIDLKKGKKIKTQFNSYEIIENKKSAFILSQEPKLKIEIDKKIIQLINLKLPLTLEYTKNSKTVLFISNDKKNLLDEIE